MDVKTIRDLSRVMRDYELYELEVESDDCKVRLSKAPAGMPAAAPTMPAPAPAAAPVTAPAPDSGDAGGDEFAGCTSITSPIPGTVYLKPNPESEAYVGPGSAVKDGDVVCLIEAMKVFNEIKSEGVAGSIKKVCVEDGQAVEYGTVLFLVG